MCVGVGIGGMQRPGDMSKKRRKQLSIATVVLQAACVVSGVGFLVVLCASIILTAFGIAGEAWKNLASKALALCLPFVLIGIFGAADLIEGPDKEAADEDL